MDIYKKYLFREFQWENQGFLSVFFFIAGLEKCLIMPLDIYNTLNIMKYILQKKEIPN